MKLTSLFRSMIAVSGTATGRRTRQARLRLAAGRVVEELEVRRLLAATSPVDNDPAANSVLEAAALGTAVGVTAFSTDSNGAAVTYSLADDAGGRFGIDATTGVVTVANGALLDGAATHSIVVEASDGAGGAASESFAIAVRNVAPAVWVGGNASATEGSTYTLNLSSTDPGADTISSWTIDWGDGSAPQVVSGNPSSVTHVYADGQPRAVLGTTLLNELKVNTPGAHEPFEYAELRGDAGAALDNLYFVSIEGDADAEAGESGSPGAAELVVGLTGHSIGASGLLAITATTGGHTIPADTSVVATPKLDNPGTALENGTNSFLLVSSPTPITEWQDYDTNDDGVLELPAGAVILDATGWSDGGALDRVYGGVVLQQSSGVSDAATRFSGDVTPNSFDAWYNADLAGSNSDTVTYSTTSTSQNFPSGGALTPGASNLPAAVLPPPRLNEIKVNPPTSSDNPYEYIELHGAPQQSLARLFFVSMEGDSTSMGRADMVVNLSGKSLGSNGLLVIKSPSGGHAVAAGTAVVTDSQLDTSGGGLENGSNSFLLIASVDPILEGTSYDADKDGVLELPAGAVIVDAIGWSDGGAGDTVYGGVALQQAGGGTGHAATRFTHDDTYRSAAAWYSGQLAGTTADSLAYDTTRASANFPSGGALTPGDGNVPASDQPSAGFAPGSGYTITATATDEDGTFSSNPTSVIVDDVPPTLAISGEASANEGAAYTLNLSSSDIGADTISSWTIDWGDGTAPETVSGNPASVTHVYADGTSTYTITAIATDDDGAYGANSVTVTVSDVAPTIAISGDGSVNEGAAYTLNLSSSDVGADTISSWTIDWGDGSAPEIVSGNPPSVTHVYTDGPNAFTIAATAADEDGAYTANTLSVTVNDVAPTPTISGAESVDEGGVYTLFLSSSDADPITSWTIDWGDGSALETVGGNASPVTHVYADGPSSYTISATATDESGTYDSNTLEVAVNDVAPALAITGAASVSEGGTYSLTLGSVSDPGPDTVTGFIVHWGDGSTSTYSSNGAKSHVYADGPNSYAITVDLVDEDGTHLDRANPLALTVENLAPSVAADQAGVTVSEGQAASNAGTWSEPGDDLATLSASAGTVTMNADGTWSWSLATTDGPNQAQTVTITATDSDGASASTTFDLVVENVAPTATISGAASVDEDATYSLTLGAASDPGADTVSGYIVHWGDGSSSTYTTGGVKGHVYADGPNSYAITVDLIDEDGAFVDRANPLEVTVNNLAPSVAANQATLTVDEGQTATNGGTWADAGDDAVTLTASLGAVTSNPDGTWSWSLPTSDGPDAQSVTITATDSDGVSASTTFDLTVNNVAPTLAVSGAASVEEGGAYTLGLSSIDPGADTIASWTIDWGDGSELETVSGSPSSVTHVYADGPNAYTLTARATDEDGTYDANSLAITVENAAPVVAAAQASVTVSEGQTATNGGTWADAGDDAVTLSASAGAVTMNDDGTWSWSLDTTDGPDQSQTVTITATDSDGDATSTTFSLAVQNVAPAVAADQASVTVSEGQTAANAGTWSDPGDDVITLSASAGAVTMNPDGTWSWSLATTDGPDQTQTVTITATDSDGGATSTTFNLVVENVAPALAANQVSLTVEEGQTATNSGTWSDAGDDAVALTASAGTVTMNADGTWSWSLATTDGPDQAQTVTITATDSDGAPTSTTFDLTVNDVAPTLAISGESSVDEGGVYTLNLSSSDVGADAISSWTIDWGDGTSPETVSGSPSSVTHVYADGTNDHTITATATDEDGTYSANTVAVTVNNVAPTIAISGAGSVDEGSAYTLNLHSSDPGDDAIDTWTIDWGDGSPVQTVSGSSSSVTHTYADGPGAYTIGATATDESGTFDSNTVSVSVNDVAPAVAISGAASVDEGGFYSLTLGAASDPGTDTVTSYIVHWGDGASSTYTSSGVKGHVYADGPSSYAITVDVVNEDGTFIDRANPLAVTVSNLAPALAANQVSLTVEEGQTATNSGTWSDAGDDAVTLTASAGTVIMNPDGTWSWSLATTDGPDQAQTVTITATDSDGGTRHATFDLTVRNVVPTLAISGEASVDEGGTYTLSLASGDPGADTISSWTIDWGDGSSPETVSGSPASVTHVYADGTNDHTITASATDEDGTYSANTVAVTVNNIAPTVAISGAASVDEGGTYTLGLSSSDPGADTISSWTIDWGDGSSPQTVSGNPSSVTHVYADGPASYTITATAADEDGTYNANSLAVTVNNVGPLVTLDEPVEVGGTLTGTGSFADGGADTWTATVDYGDGSGVQPLTLNPDKTFALSHTYISVGTYTITVTVTDHDGGVGADSATVTVDVVPPTVEASVDQTISEGSTFTDTGTYSTSGDLTTATVDYGDGSGEQTLTLNADGTFTLSHGYADDGTYTVTVTVTNAAGAATDEVLVTVNNVAPTATLTGDETGAQGQLRSFSVSVSDIGALDTVAAATVDYGDGVIESLSDLGSAFNFGHIYTATGSYTVTVTVTDDDGGTTQVSRSIVIFAVDDTQADPEDPTKTMLVVGGTTGGDLIQLTNTLTGVTVSINGVLQGVYNPTGRIIVFGQDGDDTVEIDALIALPAEVYGGGGNDSLTGGGGTNLLLGGDGDDLLAGGAGRNVMIGGAGADTLNGLAADDLLIGGTTAYDQDPVALRAIVREWTGSATYQQRVSNLQSGAFHDGTLRLYAGTVFDDAAADNLFGNLGDDWFFSSIGDTLLDKTLLETETQV